MTTSWRFGLVSGLVLLKSSKCTIEKTFILICFQHVNINFRKQYGDSCGKKLTCKSTNNCFKSTRLPNSLRQFWKYVFDDLNLKLCSVDYKNPVGESQLKQQKQITGLIGGCARPVFVRVCEGHLIRWESRALGRTVITTKLKQFFHPSTKRHSSLFNSCSQSSEYLKQEIKVFKSAPVSMTGNGTIWWER